MNWRTIIGNGNWSLPPLNLWTNAAIDGAFFNGAAPGTITVGDPITLRGIRFNANGYTIHDPAGANPLTLTAGSTGSLFDGEIQVGAGITAAMHATLAGSVGMSKTGPGTLLLGGVNTYSGGTNIFGGTLAVVVTGAPLPAGGTVNVINGATFNFGNGSTINNSGAAHGALVLNYGTYRVSGGAGDHHLNQLNIGGLGGTVDFTGSNGFITRFTGAAAGITVNGDSVWTGSGLSRIQNDTASLLPFHIGFPSTVTSSVNFVNVSAGYRLLGGGTLFLNNPTGGNTADFRNEYADLRVADMAHLGTGTITLAGSILAPGFADNAARIVYVGPTATSSKPLVLDGAGGNIFLGNSNFTLTLTGVVSEVGGSYRGLNVYGDFANQTAVLALTGANTYTGPTLVGYGGVLSIPTIANGGVASPLGMSLSGPQSLILGGSVFGGHGTLRYTGPTASTDRGATMGSAGGTIEVSTAATALTMSGPIFGTGSLTKKGPGTLVLSNNLNEYAGPTNIEAGTLKLGSALAIPFGGNVNVSPGAVFDISGQGIGGGNTIGRVLLDGGVLRRVSTNGVNYYMNRLVMSGTNPSIDAVGSTGITGILLNQANASITVASNSIWSGPSNFYIGNASGTELPFSIAAGATLTSGLSLSGPFRITGGGTYYKTSLDLPYLASVTADHSRFKVDSLNALGPIALDLTLDSGTLSYNGPTVTSSNTQFRLGAGGGTIEIANAATTATINTFIVGSGSYPLTKSGPGTLILTSTANTYAGGLFVNAGRLDVGNDAQLGLANPTVNALGTLRYTASATTARTFNLNNGTLEAASGVTLTMNGASVGGGFLRGTGTYNLTGESTLTGTTTFTSTNINVTGPATANNFANNGTITVNSGQTLGMNYATNASAGRMTINGTANVSDIVSDGRINVPTGGMLNNSASPSGIVLGGGSTTFVGTPAVPGGFINVGSQPMLVRGGLLVNNGAIGNGTGNGQVIVDYGGFAKGTGYYDTLPQTINGGKFSPGNSPGRVTVGSVNMTPGGIYDFEINNATGLAGPTGTTNLSGWVLTLVSNQISPALSNLTVSATSTTPFTINLVTLTNPSPPDVPGQMANFNPTQPFSWLAFDVNTAGSVVNWDPSAIVVNTSQFMNAFNGSFSLVRDTGNPFQFHITYTPVPEPALILTASAVELGGFGLWRRRKPK